MSTRPEYVNCIQHYHNDKRGFSWCGRRIANEFHLTSLDHAAGLAASGSRLQACPTCVGLAVVALKASTWEANQPAATTTDHHCCCEDPAYCTLRSE